MVGHEDVRRIALGLPGAYEQESFGGRPSWRTKPRMFAWIRDDPEALVVWVDSVEAKEALVGSEPATFFSTPHYDGHPVILVNLEAVDADEAAELITESWRLRSPRSLVGKLSDRPNEPSSPSPVVAADPEALLIVEHDPVWALSYAAAAAELRAVLRPWLLAVEHIGSTAVPGLAAKPVIDIQVGVRSLEESDAIVAALKSLGYEYVPDLEAELPERRYFRRWSETVRTHQIHLVERGNQEWWDRHLAFRDWLRSHPEDRDAYEVLKRRLARQHPFDLGAYTDGKTGFVQSIERRARSGP